MTASAKLATAASAAFQTGFGAVLRIIPDGCVGFDVDGRGEVCRITPPAAGAPDCVWRASEETLARIFDGGRALESAYLSGRLSIAGDMSVMARLTLESVR
jgi:putative sterol carrier protein